MWAESHSADIIERARPMELTVRIIADLIDLGVDLHICDEMGSYPGHTTREEWEKAELVRILGPEAEKIRVRGLKSGTGGK